MAGGDLVRGVGEGQEVSGEGYGAGQRQEISRANADEEVLRRGAGWGCEKEQAGEGEKGSDGGGPAWGWGVCGTKGWDHGEERDEDDDQAGDEGGFRGGGAGETGGLELIAGCEEEADDQAGVEGVTVDVAKLAAVHDGKSDECEGHAEEVEEEGGGVLEGVFDEDEGGSPDEHDCQEQDVGQSGGAESMRQLSLGPSWRVLLPLVLCRRFRR
ncbi:MAG: hypothetical protein JWQ49_3910 [Edaphobacter sp.]|nr:hypothetical protein [Edaphobacter sp.]